MLTRPQHWKGVLSTRLRNVRAWFGSRALSIRVVLLGAAVVMVLPLLAMNAALLKGYAATERACELTEHCATGWLRAARRGLADDTFRRAARALVDLAADHLDPALPRDLAAEVVETLQRRTAPDPARRQLA